MSKVYYVDIPDEIKPFLYENGNDKLVKKFIKRNVVRFLPKTARVPAAKWGAMA